MAETAMCPAEKMALAAWIAQGLTEIQWREGLHDYERKKFVDAQRAALRALAEMEPTEKMLAAENAATSGKEAIQNAILAAASEGER